MPVLPESAELGLILGKFWDERTQESAVAVDRFSPAGELDSLTAVEVMVELEDRFGLKDLPPTLIKRGGYSNREEFIEHFTGRLQKHLAGDLKADA